MQWCTRFLWFLLCKRTFDLSPTARHKKTMSCHGTVDCDLGDNPSERNTTRRRLRFAVATGTAPTEDERLWQYLVHTGQDTSEEEDHTLTVRTGDFFWPSLDGVPSSSSSAPRAGVNPHLSPPSKRTRLVNADASDSLIRLNKTVTRTVASTGGGSSASWVSTAEERFLLTAKQEPVVIDPALGVRPADTRTPDASSSYQSLHNGKRIFGTKIQVALERAKLTLKDNGREDEDWNDHLRTIGTRQTTMRFGTYLANRFGDDSAVVTRDLVTESIADTTALRYEDLVGRILRKV